MAETQFAGGRTETGAAWRIHYQVRGSGPDVILLHGGGPGATGASNYSRNIETLARHFRCWVIDFPGWGQSSKNLQEFGGPGPFHNGGRAVLAFMDAVGIECAHLIGNSFGGSSALCAAMDQPERFDRLVLMGPGGGVVSGATGPTDGIEQLLTYYLGEGPSVDKLRQFLGNLVYDTSVLTPELVQARFDASNDPEIRANPPLTRPPGGPGKETFISLDPRLATLEHRTLFIWGLQDKVNPVAGMEPFTKMPDADFVLLAKCGHWAQWEHAERFNALVTQFLS
ncbi:4,5:9,10-diseco-3-hydroxy-5,9,17-trioxoandrosta-1(10),2-diene-4-oate hydrolase [Paraburkholderia sp. GAS448]|uniref:alpha/beta fold hydrolase n=1 Tax=Paraburkholderia sp. GAS448 TaxID=3035136 RepID=UPI003D1B0D58